MCVVLYRQPYTHRLRVPPPSAADSGVHTRRAASSYCARLHRCRTHVGCRWPPPPLCRSPAPSTVTGRTGRCRRVSSSGVGSCPSPTARPARGDRVRRCAGHGADGAVWTALRMRSPPPLTAGRIAAVCWPSLCRRRCGPTCVDRNICKTP